MKTVDELVYYCHECEPVGALLLSGEWGCGKTYLIEHELKNALADTSVVLRISLFGMTLPEEIHIAVRREWMTEYCKIKGVDKVAKKIGQGKKWLSRMDFLPEWLRGIAKTDASVFFPISKEMDGKDVILVFDDLERCRMSSVDVLGVINDYCENQHYLFGAWNCFCPDYAFVYNGRFLQGFPMVHLHRLLINNGFWRKEMRI